ncbi:MAG: hypothetical protein IKE31_05530 [Eubacterium sp.]|nr:hypothetical protein [Eubacterium sp.]
MILFIHSSAVYNDEPAKQSNRLSKKNQAGSSGQDEPAAQLWISRSENTNQGHLFSVHKRSRVSETE